jgi:hypothetical protein
MTKKKPTGPDPEEVARRFNNLMRDRYLYLKTCLKQHGRMETASPPGHGRTGRTFTMFKLTGANV